MPYTALINPKPVSQPSRRLRTCDGSARSRQRRICLHRIQIELLRTTTPVIQQGSRLNHSISGIGDPASRTPIRAGLRSIQAGDRGTLEVQAGTTVAFAVVLDVHEGELCRRGFGGTDGVGGRETEFRCHGGVGHQERQGVAGRGVGEAA